MPIRRKAKTPPVDVAPSDAPAVEEAANEEVTESAPPVEEAEGEVNGEGEKMEDGEVNEESEKIEDGEANKEGKKMEDEEDEKMDDGEVNEEEGKTEDGETDVKAAEQTGEEGGEEEKKEEEDGAKKKKEKKVKRTIPMWATVSASKRVQGPGLHGHAKLDVILVEAIKASKERNGATVPAIMKYITNTYVTMDLDQKRFHIRKALKRLIDKGVVKQLRGKGLSGSLTIGKLPLKAAIDMPVVAPGVKAETLGDALPLIMTRLCVPKEASYALIKKYLEQHFPRLAMDRRPELLKVALQRAVRNGHLEQITGKGASGTFQLKRFGGKGLLKGGTLECAILTAITAMNEPKSCSTALLRKFLVETHKDVKAYVLVNNLKRTLKRCKMMGWMEQVTGTGLNGTYQLCYPYYPSPAILFPNKCFKESEDSEGEDEDDDDEDDEDYDESVYEAPPKKRYTAPQRLRRSRRPPPAKRPAATARRSGPPRKKPKSSARKVAPPAEAPSSRSRAVARKSRAAKKSKPASRTKTPVDKEDTSACKTKTPMDEEDTPTSKTKTPVEKDTRTRKTKIQVGKESTPTCKSKTQVDKKDMPTSESKTPMDEKDTPTTKTKTLVKEENAPTSESKTPVDEEDTPTSKTKALVDKDTCTRKSKTQVDKEATPTRKSKTPVDEEDTPTRKTRTSVVKDIRKSKTPVDEDTPTSKTKTPMAKKMSSRTPKPAESAPTQATRKSARSTK